MVRESFFSLRGVSGERFIKFYDSGSGPQVHVGPEVTKTSERDALYLCGEAGCMYQTIQRTVCEYEEGETNRRSNKISRAFAAAVTAELHDYSTFLTTIQPRSLRHVVAVTAPHVRKLKDLLLITNTRLNGPDLLSWLYRLQQTNDEHTQLHAMVTRIQRATSRPWYDSLSAWVVGGMLDDPNFFITAIPNIRIRDMWNAGHTMDRSKVPDGLLSSNGKVDLCYQVGRGVHYIRRVLFDVSWQPPTFDVNSDSSLQEVAKSVHAHVLDTLETQHNMQVHLHALKQFLLLGQGDFYAMLLDGIHATEGTVYKHTLAVLVDTALQGIIGLADECCERLHVAVNDHLDPNHPAYFAVGSSSTTAKTGSIWDIFQLNYTLPDPLFAIINQNAVEMYQRMFRTLWNIRKVEHHLSVLWQQNSVLQRALHVNAQHLNVTVHINSNYAQAISLLRQVSMVRQSMMHFVVNLQSYLQMDVLEVGWKRLLRKIEEAETLEAITAAHDSYLEIMARQGFGNSDDSLGTRVKSLLHIANAFCTYQDEVFQDALESVDRAAERRRQAEWLADQGTWGFETKHEEEESCFGLSDPSLVEKLGNVTQVFHREMNLFLGQLDQKLYGGRSAAAEFWDQQPTAGESLDDDLDALRFLAGQLSNNNFYDVVVV